MIGYIIKHPDKYQTLTRKGKWTTNLYPYVFTLEELEQVKQDYLMFLVPPEYKQMATHNKGVVTMIEQAKPFWE